MNWTLRSGARIRRISWREVNAFVPVARDTYRHVLNNDEQAFDELIVSVPLRGSEALDLLQHYVAGTSAQVLHHDRSLSELDRDIDAWTNFLAMRTDRTKMKMLLRRYIDATEPMPFHPDSHFDYVAQYMPIVVALGAFGLANCPPRYAPWTTEFDTIVKLMRRDMRRVALRGRMFTTRADSGQP